MSGGHRAAYWHIQGGEQPAAQPAALMHGLHAALCPGVRLFGFLGAGATLGQLAGSLAATAAGRLASQRGGHSTGGDAAATGLQLTLLLGAAALMECAGRLVGGVRRSPGQTLGGGAQLGSRDRLLEDGLPANKVRAYVRPYRHCH